ncbi:unnamed protein product [Closterium sp. NIES-64]|nr:unnamed protein product [Closterium sp. NIES-64]
MVQCKVQQQQGRDSSEEQGRQREEGLKPSPPGTSASSAAPCLPSFLAPHMAKCMLVPAGMSTVQHVYGCYAAADKTWSSHYDAGNEREVSGRKSNEMGCGLQGVEGVCREGCERRGGWAYGGVRGRCGEEVGVGGGGWGVVEEGGVRGGSCERRGVRGSGVWEEGCERRGVREEVWEEGHLRMGQGY